MPTFLPPDPAKLRAWLSGLKDEPLSYDHMGGIGQPPQNGFIVDTHRTRLGDGEAVYHRACEALRAWKMFPLWADVHPHGAPQENGTVVAMVTRIAGLWWINPCRILKRIDNDGGSGVRRCGFVYGTLCQHAECGEERFMVEMRKDGSVWYEICAFSRPRHWMAWLGFPLARWWQCRFVRDSQNDMRGIATAERT